MRTFLDDPRVRLIGAMLVLTLVFVYVLHRVHSHLAGVVSKSEPDEHKRHLWRELLRIALGPLSLVVWYYGFYAMARVAVADGWLPDRWAWIQEMLHHAGVIGFLVAMLWFSYGVAAVLDRYLRGRAARTNEKWDDV